MKLIHTADLHLGMINYSKFDPESGLESRLLDFFKTFDFLVDTAISQNIDAFIFAGDAYKTRDPSPTQQRGFGERLRKLTRAGIPVILVVGNHDTPMAEGKANTLDIYSALELDQVWVSRKPEFLNIPTKSGNLQIITAPWLHRGDLKVIGEKLLSMYQKIKSGEPAVLVGHLEVEGSVFGSEKGLVISGDSVIPLSLLTSPKLNYVALGHIHKYQILSNPPAGGPPVIYSGSLERIDFGEEKEEKGFVLVELSAISSQSSDKIKTSFQFIPTKARKFLTITLNLKEDDKDPTQTILQEIEKNNVKETIVRLIINIPANLGKDIEMDKIKKALSDAHFIAGISRNVAKTERTRLEGTEEVERLTPLEALQKYFESKKFSPEKIKELEKFAASLFE
ncbi:MAG: exonuclease SbcCD subunit D [Candidatus Daviesbacteria bacterium]